MATGIGEQGEKERHIYAVRTCGVLAPTLKAAAESNDHSHAEAHEVVAAAVRAGRDVVGVLQGQLLAVRHEGGPCAGVYPAVELRRHILWTMLQVNLSFYSTGTLLKLNDHAELRLIPRRNH